MSKRTNKPTKAEVASFAKEWARISNSGAKTMAKPGKKNTKRKAAKKAAPAAAKKTRRTGKAKAARAARERAPTLGERSFSGVKIRCYGKKALVKGKKLRPRGFCYATAKAA